MRAEKRDRDAEIETDDGVDAETSLSLSLHLYLFSPPSHFILTLTFGQIKLSLKSPSIWLVSLSLTTGPPLEIKKSWMDSNNSL